MHMTMTNQQLDNSQNQDCHHDCTLAVIRALTRPFLHPPSLSVDHDDSNHNSHRLGLKDALMAPWNVRVPVDPTDYTTRNHWQHQKETPLFRTMFDWERHNTNDSKAAADVGVQQQQERPKSTASLYPYFSFGSNPTSPFFAPWQDVGNCLRNLLLHQIESHQNGQFISLISHETVLFVATGPNFQEAQLRQAKEKAAARHPDYYLLRCHYNKTAQKLIFGYHHAPSSTTTMTMTRAAAEQQQEHQFQIFHKLHTVSLEQDDWRLITCIILKNLARILYCLKDYTVPLVWSNSDKLSLMCCSYNCHENSNGEEWCIQKIYETDNICSIFGATVTNMIQIYQAIEKAHVPHTDRLVSVVMEDNPGGGGGHSWICQFAPVGRSYLPENLQELLEALICVCESLVVLHAAGIMHRDIRWANVFHALTTTTANDNDHHSPETAFSNEWILFDFEFAAFCPQPAFGAHTLTPGNHAPEMINTDDDEMIRSEYHDTAVDIWGLGYLIQQAHVDIPLSHANDMETLQRAALQKDPTSRPTAAHCLDILRALQERPCSTEKDVVPLQ
jgi:hypothetical protein